MAHLIGLALSRLSPPRPLTGCVHVSAQLRPPVFGEAILGITAHVGAMCRDISDWPANPALFGRVYLVNVVKRRG